jgi:hypothetical protein
LSKHLVITGTDDAALIRAANRDLYGAFPEFMYHNKIMKLNFPELFGPFAQYQFIIVEPDSRAVLALGNSIPLYWAEPLEKLPDNGIEWATETAVKQFRKGQTPNILCAFQIIVPDKVRGMGMSYEAVKTMVDIGHRFGLISLIAPVRPNLKSEYPELPMDEYINWKRADGLPFDDWIRVHIKLGAKILRICDRSYAIKASIKDWEGWTGIRFTSSGSYTMRGGLVPLIIDLENDIGIYIEPNVWMAHNITI